VHRIRRIQTQSTPPEQDRNTTLIAAATSTLTDGSTAPTPSYLGTATIGVASPLATHLSKLVDLRLERLELHLVPGSSLAVEGPLVRQVEEDVVRLDCER